MSMTIPYIFLAVILSSLFLFYLIKRWQKSKISKFLPLFYNGEIKSNYVFYPKIKGLYNSIPCEVNFYPASKTTPPQMKILFDYNENERWKIYKKNSNVLDLSLLPKIKTGDFELDHNFIIRSKEEGAFQPIINTPKKRKAIFNLFEKKGSILLEAKKGKLIFRINFDGLSNLTYEELMDILDNLINFCL